MVLKKDRYYRIKDIKTGQYKSAGGYFFSKHGKIWNNQTLKGALRNMMDCIFKRFEHGRYVIVEYTMIQSDVSPLETFIEKEML